MLFPCNCTALSCITSWKISPRDQLPEFGHYFCLEITYLIHRFCHMQHSALPDYMVSLIWQHSSYQSLTRSVHVSLSAVHSHMLAMLTCRQDPIWHLEYVVCMCECLICRSVNKNILLSINDTKYVFAGFPHTVYHHSVYLD